MGLPRMSGEAYDLTSDEAVFDESGTDDWKWKEGLQELGDVHRCFV
jgi:hypothetical protein